MLWIYATALKRSWECVRRNWVVIFAPAVYGILLTVIASLVAPFGIIGGLLYSIAVQACLSSGLFLIKNMIESNKANINDFLNGFTVYLWKLLAIAFILWIPMRIAGTVLASVPSGAFIYLLIQLVLFILLNAVPELIYQTRTSGLELIGASYNFMVENWLVWLLAHLPVAALCVYYIWLWLIVMLDLPHRGVGWIQLLLSGLPRFAIDVLFSFLSGLALTYFMTFRGFLFAQLYGTTRRSRLYRYKAQS